MKSTAPREWQVAEARKRLAAVLVASSDEPQIITRRGEVVAAVIGPSEYERYAAWRRRQDLPLSALFDELRDAVADGEGLSTAPRGADRANPFDDLDE